MNIRDPLFMFTPDFDHCQRRLHTLIKDSDRAVAVTANEDVTGDLIGSEGCDA